MFDPVSLIVGALVNGLLAGVQASAQEAVTDGYRALRDSISRKYGDRVTASVAMLERNPESPQCRAAVARELRAAGADADRQLIDLAERLRVLVENPEQVLFGQDRVEQVQRRSALGAIGRVLDEHIVRVQDARANHSVEATDLLTANVSRAGSVDQQVRDGVLGLHDRIRGIIEQIAERIESSRYQEVEHAIIDLQAGLAERQWATRLVQTEKQMHVSYESLRLTVEFLSALNQNILSRIENETQPQRLSNMMFGNAIVIFELTDFVIGYIRGFALGGDLDQLHQEAKRRVGQAREQQRALEEQLRGREIPATVRDQILADVRSREDAFKQLDLEWDSYLGEVEQMRGMVEEVRTIVPTLEMVRENARIQIMTLQLVAMLRVLKQNSESIRGMVDTLQGFRLAPLSSTRVRRLLGIEVVSR